MKLHQIQPNSDLLTALTFYYLYISILIHHVATLLS